MVLCITELSVLNKYFKEITILKNTNDEKNYPLEMFVLPNTSPFLPLIRDSLCPDGSE